MSQSPAPITRLLDIMAALRDPETGCPWDREQDFATIAPYTIEEAYEVVDAIQQGDMPALCEELGDLLFQVVFYTQMSREAGGFTFDDVVSEISEKMIRRHPHVFADSTGVTSAEAQTRNWESIKAVERSDKSATATSSVLDNLPRGFPALLRAYKLQRRAARVGFDWPEIAPVYGKVYEEIDEVKGATANCDRAGQTEEIGDLLFACVNLARHLNVDPESALQAANSKFESRFRRVEESLNGRGRSPAQSDLEEMDELWERVKSDERGLATRHGTMKDAEE